MDDDDLIDGEWHPEAFRSGQEARSMGRKMDDASANPYIDYGATHWMLKSFRAGWCDMDQVYVSAQRAAACCESEGCLEGERNG